MEEPSFLVQTREIKAQPFKFYNADESTIIANEKFIFTDQKNNLNLAASVEKS